MLPQPLLELRKQFEGVVAEYLLADPQGVGGFEVSCLDLFGQDFGQAAAGLVLNSTSSTAIGLTELALQTIVKGANA